MWNAHSDIRVVMETRKENRRVVAVKFRVREAPDAATSAGESVDGVAAALVGRPLPDPRLLAPEPAEIIGDHPLAALQRRLLSFGLTEAQALDLSTEFPEARVAANLDHVEGEVARGLQSGGREVKNVAAYTVAAVRGDYAASGGTPPVVRQAASRQQAAESAGVAAKAKAAQAKAAALESRETAEQQSRARLDAAWNRLSLPEQEALTARAVARMKVEAPQAYTWYTEELAGAKAEDEMRASVRATLRSYRHEEMGRLL